MGILRQPSGSYFAKSLTGLDMPTRIDALVQNFSRNLLRHTQRGLPYSDLRQPELLPDSREHFRHLEIRGCGCTVALVS